MLLASLSLITVGFSSWIILNTGSADADMEVDAALVVDVPIFSNARASTFVLTKDGMVQDGVITTTGSLSVSMKINNVYCHDLSYLDASNNLTFKLTLTCTDSAFITSYVSAPTVNVGTLTQSGTEGSVYNVTVPIDTSVAETDFNVTYPVSGDISSYYGQGLKFTFKAEVSK